MGDGGGRGTAGTGGEQREGKEERELRDPRDSLGAVASASRCREGEPARCRAGQGSSAEGPCLLAGKGRRGLSPARAAPRLECRPERGEGAAVLGGVSPGPELGVLLGGCSGSRNSSARSAPRPDPSVAVLGYTSGFWRAYQVPWPRLGAVLAERACVGVWERSCKAVSTVNMG